MTILERKAYNLALMIEWGYAAGKASIRHGRLKAIDDFDPHAATKMAELLIKVFGK